MTVTEDELALRRARADGDGESAPPAPEAEAPDPEAPAAAPEAEAEKPPEEPKPTPPMQIPLPGDWEAIGGEFGGRQPDRSEIRLLGGKMPIDGSFDKGTEFDILVRVKVTGVLGQDTVDAFGTEEGTVRRHFARMISVRRVNNPTRTPGA